MQTPNDHLRALLLELAHEADLTDGAIARAHNRAYPGSTLNTGTVNRFRNGYVDKKGVKRLPEPGTAPSQLMEEAFAAALETTREKLWDEAFKRWRAAMKADAEKAVRRRSA